MGKERHVLRVHLFHGDAHAHAVGRAVDDQQLLARGAVAVADHASIVGVAEEAMEVLEGGQRFIGP